MKITSIPGIPAMFVCVALILILIAAGADAQDTKPATPAEVSGGQTADFFPEAYRLDRHEPTWSASPFSREVLPPPPPEMKQGPDPWKDWKLATIDRFGGKYTVGLVDKKNKFHLMKLDEENEDGIKITKVESNGRLSDTVIHLASGTRTGTLDFDSKRLSVASKGAPVPKKAAPRKAPSRTVARPHGMTKEQAAALLKQRAAAAKTIQEHMLNNARKRPEPPKRRSVVLPPK